MNVDDSLGIDIGEADIDSMMQELHELKMRFRVAKSKIDGFVGVKPVEENFRPKHPDPHQPTIQKTPSSNFHQLEEKRLRLREVEEEMEKRNEVLRKHEKEKQELVKMIESVRQEVSQAPHTVHQAKMEREDLLVELCDLERAFEETKWKVSEEEEKLRGLQSMLEENSEDLQCSEHQLQEKSLELQELVERVVGLEARAEQVRQVPACPNKRGNSEFVRLEDRSDKYRERLSAMRLKYNRKRAELSKLTHQLTVLREELARLSVESSLSPENPEVARVKWQIIELKKKEMEQLKRVSQLEADLSLPKICPEDPTNPTSVANTNCACAMVQHQREEWESTYRELKERSEQKVKEVEQKMELDNRCVELSLQLHKTKLRVENLSALVLQLGEKNPSEEKEVKKVQFAETGLTTMYPPAESPSFC